MGYYENRKRAQITTVGATKTDQSAAKNTDINVIARQAMIHGTAPGSAKPPIYGDFSDIPNNLRDMLELSKSIAGHKSQLPPALQDMTVEELVTTPPDKLHERIQQEGLYVKRHGQLPAHLKNLPKPDILKMSEKEFSDMISPPAPTPAPTTGDQPK